MNSDLPGREYLGCGNSPQSDHRTAYPKDTFFTRNDQDASSITNGVDIGPISLSSKSGFSEFMDVHYDSARGSGIWLCGTNHYAPTAGVIHAQDR
jgi:hypothetical protein